MFFDCFRLTAFSYLKTLLHMKDIDHHPPPKWALRFFRWFCHPGYAEDIEGDLHERFALLVEELGLTKARRRFVLEVLLLFRPGLMRSVNNSNLLIHPGMIKHNLLITYRGFLRDKSTFLINLIGLSTGLACVLLIYLWVNDEMSVDKFHEKDSQLYQVMCSFHNPEGIGTGNRSSLLLTDALKEDFPEVEAAALAVNYYDTRGTILYDGKALKANRMLVSEQFLEVFSYDLIHGESKAVLASKDKVVISEALATKLFQSTTDVVGKSIEWSNPDFNGTFQVSGVFATPPANSTQQFDALFHYDLLVDEDPPAAQWNSSSAINYLVLKKGTDISDFNKKIETYLWSKDPNTEKLTLSVQQYSDYYLHGRYENGKLAGGRIEYVRYFSILAFFILLIACVNFMNLSTAQASRKMKEIGVKKAVGANRYALTIQFLGESVLMVLIALVFALTLAAALIPQFNVITGKTIQFLPGLNMILAILGIGLFTGLLAGSYPAFYLSGFHPIDVIKGKRNIALGGEWIRKSLVIFQFAASVIFIVGVWVVEQQIAYTQTKNMGYSRDNVISFQRPRHNDDLELFLMQLQQLPGVNNASNVEGSFIRGGDAQSGFSWSGEDTEKKWLFKSPQVGFDMIETLGMNLLAGRSFSRAFQDDDSKIIINESAMKMMQLKDPIGRIITKKAGKGVEERQIIGVVSDFHYGPLHNKVKPLIFRLRHHGRNILAKIEPGAAQNAITEVEKLFKEFHPGYTFNFTFLDESNQRLYEAENRVAALSKYFALLAIIISCLGLFGLAAFTAERRFKEIGIRKILGSSVWGIVKLLSTDFTKMVVIAILVALPISYLITQTWLNNFAYKIELEWWYFAGTALMTLLIAWSVIGLQTFKTARLNPVECLRDE